MDGLLVESHFLPSLEYFCVLQAHHPVVIELHENYVKQTYRNRCYILGANSVERLTVPVTMKHGKVSMKSIQIDYSYRWQANLWRTIQSAYAKSPYFEHYGDDLRAELFSNEKHLIDLNQRLLSMCLKWLTWKKAVSFSTSYDVQTELTDLRGVISAKSDFTHRSFYHAHPYHQVFGKAFVPNLSILDLVCCVGPEAGRVIQSSASTI